MQALPRPHRGQRRRHLRSRFLAAVVGDATVEVAIVNWTKGKHPGPKTLWLTRGTTKMEVPEITGSLSPNTDFRAAQKLKTNMKPKLCFQGQTPQNTPGFVLSPEQAARFVKADPKARDVIHPFLIGEELFYPMNRHRQ